MESIRITWENMDRYSAVPIEYRFVDWAEVIPGKEARGYKAVSSQDWFFKFHFPGDITTDGFVNLDFFRRNKRENNDL